MLAETTTIIVPRVNYLNVHLKTETFKRYVFSIFFFFFYCTKRKLGHVFEIFGCARVRYTRAAAEIFPSAVRFEYPTKKYSRAHDEENKIKRYYSGTGLKTVKLMSLELVSGGTTERRTMFTNKKNS